MADPNLLASLPPEYQAQIADFLRQKQMAQMFQQQAMQGMNAPTQFTPGPQSRAVRTSPLSTLAQGLTAYLGNKKSSEADQGIAGVQQKFADSESQAVTKFMGLPQDQQSAMGPASQSPQVRKLAEALAKRRWEAAQAQGRVLGEYGDPGAATRVLASGSPMGDYTPTPIPAPQIGSTPGPNGTSLPIVTTTNRKGEQTVRGLGGQTINIDAKAADRQNEMSMDDLKAQRKTRSDAATAAKDSLSASIAAYDAINEGAQAGGGEGLKQGVRKALQAFGVKTDPTTPTEQLQMALGQNILANARKLAPVTAEDIVRLEQVLGSINTDPDALHKALSIYTSIAVKELSDFNRFVETKTKDLTSPLAASVFSGANIGFELPKKLPGTTSQSLRILQELQKRGGDITQWKDAVGPIPEDAQFNIKGQGTSGAAPGGRAWVFDPATGQLKPR